MKHESNAPSRFIKEIDPQYIENPLEDADFDNSGVTHEWGGFGSRFTGGRLDRFGVGGGTYGQSSGVQYQKRGASGSRLAPNRFGIGESANIPARRGGENRLTPGGVAARGFVNGGDPQPKAVGGMRTQSEPIRRQSGSPAGMLADANFVGVPMTELRAGQRIEHNRFGVGTILELSGRAPEMKARIRFDAHGEKLLLLKYAKLRPAE